MSVPIFIGNCGWQQITPTKWSVDSYGCDRASVLYKGRVDQKDAFESKQVGFQAYAVSGAIGQAMWLVDWSNTGGSQNLPETEYHFAGFRNGKVPVAKVVYGSSANSFSATVQYPQTGPGSNAVVTNGAVTTDTFTGMFQYRAVRATYTYWALQAPGSSPPTQYATIPEAFQVFPLSPSSIFFEQIIDTSWDVSAANGQPAPIPVGVFAALINQAGVGMFVSDYNVEIVVPGNLYHCTSVVDYKVLSGG